MLYLCIILIWRVFIPVEIGIATLEILPQTNLRLSTGFYLLDFIVWILRAWKFLLCLRPVCWTGGNVCRSLRNAVFWLTRSLHIFLVKFCIACNAALAAALVHKISPSPAFCAPRAVGKISCKTLQLTRAKKMEEDEDVWCLLRLGVYTCEILRNWCSSGYFWVFSGKESLAFGWG